jgi:hypothetical protein
VWTNSSASVNGISWISAYGEGWLYQHEGAKYMKKLPLSVPSCLEEMSTFKIRATIEARRDGYYRSETGLVEKRIYLEQA